VTIAIRKATLNDASTLAELGARTFSDAFAAENRPEDLALHLARSYGMAQQSVELASSRIATLLAEAEGEAIGFAQLREGGTPSCVTGQRPVELWRFYVTAAWHGRGVASMLMDAVMGEARRRLFETLWLGVWERNPRARAFYRKSGFVDVGSQVFYVGNDPQPDRILARPVRAPHSPTGMG